MSSKNVVTLRLNDDELNKLNELTDKSNQSKSDVLRNLIMTADSNSKDQLSIEILQRLFMLIQIVLGTIKDFDEKIRIKQEERIKLPIKITQEWIDEIIDEAKKRYPTS